MPGVCSVSVAQKRVISRPDPRGTTRSRVSRFLRTAQIRCVGSKHASVIKPEGTDQRCSRPEGKGTRCGNDRPRKRQELYRRNRQPRNRRSGTVSKRWHISFGYSGIVPSDRIRKTGSRQKSNCAPPSRGQRNLTEI